jgi:hypothetical protein
LPSSLFAHIKVAYIVSSSLRFFVHDVPLHARTTLITIINLSDPHPYISPLSFSFLVLGAHIVQASTPLPLNKPHSSLLIYHNIPNFTISQPCNSTFESLSNSLSTSPLIQQLITKKKENDLFHCQGCSHVVAGCFHLNAPW